jgi:GNAT superfamily N-acetyltransferase
LGLGDKKAIELNEVEWWSKWGRVRWLGSRCYVLSSRDFGEPFFNRAGFLSCDASNDDLRRIEADFARASQVPHIMLLESCTRSGSLLKGHGYADVDRMVVMSSGSDPIQRSEGVLVRPAASRDVNEWCETYLLSFYGALLQKPQVLRIVKRLSRLDKVTLLVAEFDGRVAGVTALYRSPGLLGLYCLGTVPTLRGRGVARSLLGSAQGIAAAEGRTLVLQSLLSEETHPFYRRFGFHKLYVKRFLQRTTPTETPSPGKKRLAIPDVVIRKEPGVGPHLFAAVFQAFERVGAVTRIFGDATEKTLSELSLEVVDEKGYMHINAIKGSIVVSASYLKDGDQSYLYLDAIHELVHIRQHMQGKELWDRSYKYVDRPTELEAYRITVAEARRIGFTDEQLVDYLKVEWVSVEDFARFLVTLGVKRP